MGLQEGYSAEQWGPWKSHGLLLQQAIAELGWQDNAALLVKIFRQFSKTKEGYLSRDEFSQILIQYPCCNQTYHAVFFELFDRNQDGFLNESDFLGGILAVSPTTPHKLEAPSGQLRMQFIFLYYDANRNGRLEVDEIAKMIEHIQQLRGQPHSDAMVDATALVSLYSGPFGFAAFYDATQKRMLNGTSPLLRTQQDLLEAARQQQQGQAGGPARPPSRQNPTIASAPNQPSSPLPSRTDLQDGSPGGYPGSSSNMAGTTGTNGRVASTASAAPQPPSSQANQTVSSGAPGQTQVAAGAAGIVQSGVPGNQSPGVVHGRASVINPNGPRQPSYGGPSAYRGASYWGGVQSQGGPQGLALKIVRRLMELSNGLRNDWRYGLQLASAHEMLTLCDTVVEILRNEDSLVEVPLPCRVYGDIHGQLLDLLEFFNAFSWPDKRRGDIFSMNYVFLGDFVDRGNYSVDVICLLFSLKILYPTKVFLIRGNHEDRLMNVNYGFQADCLRKFGNDGENLWERVNDVFEFLPIAALVESTILCIHGGIGDSINTLDDLRSIPKPITVVGEINASTTWRDRMILDALWSDPTDNDTVLGVHLSPRGKNTCRFGPDRVQDFNRRNGLKLIIRAHECVQHGYEYFAAGQLLTVFSATNYCNQYNNDGAMVVLVKDDKTGEVVEHAQVIKSGTVDTSHGWNEQQFRAPSPMRRAPNG